MSQHPLFYNTYPLLPDIPAIANTYPYFPLLPLILQPYPYFTTHSPYCQKYSTDSLFYNTYPLLYNTCTCTWAKSKQQCAQSHGRAEAMGLQLESIY